MTIGILIDPPLMKVLLAEQPIFEVPNAYYSQITKDEDILFFTLKEIDWKTRSVEGYLFSDGKWQKRKSPIPSVIHNRSLNTRPIWRKGEEKLSSYSYLFNQHNRWDKWETHRFLHQDDLLSIHLPETKPLTRDQLSSFLEKHQVVFLKPRSSSLGMGIYKLSKEDKMFCLSWVEKNQMKTQEFTGKQLISLLKRKIKKPYILQEGIKLKTYKGNPFDLRVAVQRNERNEWQVSGMAAKVAQEGGFLTNIAHGGQAISMKELKLEKAIQEEEIEAVERVSLLIAKRLEEFIPHLSDIGLDMAVDENNQIYFIEANGRDLRIIYAQAGEEEMWKKTYYTPLSHACAHLSKTKENK